MNCFHLITDTFKRVVLCWVAAREFGAVKQSWPLETSSSKQQIQQCVEKNFAFEISNCGIQFCEILRIHG